MKWVMLACFPLAGWAADQWPQFRGPDGKGVAQGSAPVEFGAKQALWSVELTPGHSSPSIWGNHIFLTSFDSSAKKLEVLDLDRSTGKIRWRQTVPASAIEEVHAVSSPATATPIVDGERVYVYFGSAGLFAFDLEGKPVWSAPLPVAKTAYGSGTSPALVGEAIILARDNPGEEFMAAYDRKTGKELWKSALGGRGGGRGSHAIPIAWRDQIVLHRTNEITGYDGRNGARQWSVQVTSEGTGTPAIHENTLYVAAWLGAADLMDPMPDWNTLVEKYDRNHDGMISQDEFPPDLAIARRVDAANTPGAIVLVKNFFSGLDEDHDGQLSKKEWEAFLQGYKVMLSRPRGLLAIRLDSDAKTVNWKEERAVPEVPTPLFYNNRLYAVTNGGVVTSLDPGSGKLMYRGRLGAGGIYYSSPVAANGRIYFASGDGVVSVIDAGMDELKVVARNDLGEPIFATPAIVDGKIYVRTVAHLFAFGN
jgi:outer membrane protein assembly factor BamB